MKIIRTLPLAEQYFVEEIVENGNANRGIERGVVNVYDEFSYQEILGFGGAFTESAAYNYSLLNDEQKKDFMEKYFDKEKGIAYNFGRTCINSCDFSIAHYTYIEEGDEGLESFDISHEKQYVLPFIKDAQKYTGEGLTLFASPWSPPAFMKTNETPFKGGSLKEEYKATWAKYYTKYIKAFAAEGIVISAVSVQNEPKAIQPWESCYYSAEDERDFIEKYLAPALDEAGLSDIKVIVWDHNKERVYERAKRIFTSKAVEDRVWAVGHHWYSGDHFEGLRLVHEKFDKTLICSEICGVISGKALDVAENYAKELCGDFNNFTAGFCDWNLLLDDEGGPFHNRSWKAASTEKLVYEDKGIGCYAPVLYNRDEKKLEYTPIYYYIGHFSKCVERGAHRIATTKYSDQLHTCAFENPDGTHILVIANTSGEDQPTVVRYNNEATAVPMPAHSIATVLF